MGLLTEYINKRWSVKDYEAELLRLIKQYNDYNKENNNRETFLFVYAGAISKQIPDVSFSMVDYYSIADIIREIDCDNLDFYIETPGGSGEAVEEVVKFIRDHFKGTVSFVVSGEAKSAGTLLVLSADEIYMTETGSLGPIDAQIKIGRSYISAYDYMEWIESKYVEAEENGSLNPLDATMIAQISPGEIKRVNHGLKFAIDLVTEWLPKYKFKDWDKTETRGREVTQEMKGKRAAEIANELTKNNKWRSHGRSIKINDLVDDVKLRINCIDDDPKMADIVYRIQTVIRMIFDGGTAYKIYATSDEKVFKHAVKSKIAKTNIQKVNPQDASCVILDVQCQKCGRKHKCYAKFELNDNIDTELKQKGLINIGENETLKCECGFEIDLIAIRNKIEDQSGKKILK